MENTEQINYIKTPLSTAYKALTSEEGLGQVWTRKLKVEHKPGYINKFDFDEGYPTMMKIVEIHENRKIIWECIASDKEWV